MRSPTLEDMRRVPGFPQPGPWARLSLWFEDHKHISITLWLLGLVVGQFVYYLFVWLPYMLLARRGRKKYLTRVEKWWHDHGLDWELSRLA